MQEKFPQKSDYPDSFSTPDNPYKDINLYIQLFAASASVILFIINLEIFFREWTFEVMGYLAPE